MLIQKRKQKLLLAALLSATLAGNAVAQNGAQRAGERTERQIERQSQRLEGRGAYYDAQTWQQISPWLSRNEVRPLNPIAGAASAVAKRVDRTADVSAAAVTTGPGAVATYGYSNQASPATGQGWFYDYYSMQPTVYGAPAAVGAPYTSAARYRDLNNDGLYDTIATYRDPLATGRFNTYSRVDFTDAPAVAAAATAVVPADAEDDSALDARQHTITGVVDDTKNVEVNGSDNLLVHVVGPSGNNQNAVVDLGPAQRWSTKPINKGDRVTAVGPLEMIGGKSVIVAETVKLSGQEVIPVDRVGPAVQGEVVDVMRAQVRNSEHVLAIINAGDQRQVVDLGPAANLKVNIEPRTQIVVQGVPVASQDHRILLADRVTVAGQTYSIPRW